MGLTTATLVHWECRSETHRTLRSRRGEGGLTVNEGAWAYCDGAGAEDGHSWASTGGVPLAALIRWSAPNGKERQGTNGAPPVVVANGTKRRRSAPR